MRITRIKRGNRFTNIISAKPCEFFHLKKGLNVISKVPNAPILLQETNGLHDSVLILTDDFIANYRSDNSPFPNELKKLIEGHIDKWKIKEKVVLKKKKKQENYHKIKVE